VSPLFRFLSKGGDSIQRRSSTSQSSARIKVMKISYRLNLYFHVTVIWLQKWLNVSGYNFDSGECCWAIKKVSQDTQLLAYLFKFFHSFFFETPLLLQPAAVKEKVNYSLSFFSRLITNTTSQEITDKSSNLFYYYF
jgi:hypothetical protein